MRGIAAMFPTQGPVTPVTKKAFSVIFSSATAAVARRKAACQSPAPVALAGSNLMNLVIDVLALNQLCP
ncbi:hypothetical protein TMatcc_010234 [Talaromyces marneffei ATCC 18224]